MEEGYEMNFALFVATLFLGTMISFFILVPEVKKKQESRVCRNGELMEKHTEGGIIIFEKISSNFECENIK